MHNNFFTNKLYDILVPDEKYNCVFLVLDYIQYDLEKVF